MTSLNGDDAELVQELLAELTSEYCVPRATMCVMVCSTLLW